MHYQLRAEEGALERLLDTADPMEDVHAAVQTDLARLAAGYDSKDLLLGARRTTTWTRGRARDQLASCAPACSLPAPAACNSLTASCSSPPSQYRRF